MEESKICFDVSGGVEVYRCFFFRSVCCDLQCLCLSALFRLYGPCCLGADPLSRSISQLASGQVFVSTENLFAPMYQPDNRLRQTMLGNILFLRLPTLQSSSPAMYKSS